jgi:hypothetical protein
MSFTKTIVSPFNINVDNKDALDGFNSLKSDSEEGEFNLENELISQEIHFGYDKSKSYLLNISRQE